jgi:UMF1 family MFS transporter
MGAKKRFLAAFIGFGATFTACLWYSGEGKWVFTAVVFILANAGFAGANVFYEALLPSLARGKELDRASTAGFALGYFGGGVLLALNAAWYLWPGTFGFEDPDQAVRASFVSVAVWWVVFSFPLFRSVKEPGRRLARSESGDLNAVSVGFGRVSRTLKAIRRHPDLFLFLLAFLVYNDGVGTIIKMASIYGAEVGIGTPHLIGALILVQFVGVPFTFGFGQFAGRLSARQGIYICLVVYSGITVLGFFMDQAWHFWALAVAVASVQGGVQGLSRSLFASMIPVGRATEFFGFYSVSSKFAGIAGPLVFATVGLSSGTSRWAILSLVVFFLVGGILLTRVDVEAGQRLAREVDGAMMGPEQEGLL